MLIYKAVYLVHLKFKFNLEKIDKEFDNLEVVVGFQRN